MTDKEIIDGLITRDNHITEDFFFVKCRPLFLSIIRKVFDYEVEYNELVNELYIYLMDNDAKILKDFEFRSSVFQWLKVLATHFFVNKRNILKENRNGDTPIEELDYQIADEYDSTIALDFERLLSLMPNQRYAYVIRRLFVDDWENEKLAAEMNTTLANLYNIKKRAIEQLTKVALNDIKEYGK